VFEMVFEKMFKSLKKKFDGLIRQLTDSQNLQTLQTSQTIKPSNSQTSQTIKQSNLQTLKLLKQSNPSN
jgi:hypothetical protein